MDNVFPEGYKKMFVSSFGESAWEAYLSAYIEPYTRGMRIHPLRKVAFPFTLGTSIPWAANAYFVSQAFKIGNDPLHAAGCLYLQEPTAMAPVTVLAPVQGENILDLCAAPGGKTTQIGALMENTGVLLANDPHPARAEALAENIERWGLSHTAVANVEPKRLSRSYRAFFDGILVDAPCSGEGLFRREPEATAHWSLENLMKNAMRQLEILEEAYQMLKPGGRLVYSTCTFNPIENELVCAKFAMAHPDLQLLPIALPEMDAALSPTQLKRAGQAHPLIQDVLDTMPSNWDAVPTHHAGRFFPHHAKGEGHFIARFIKQHSAVSFNKAKPDRITSAKNRTLKTDFESFAKEFFINDWLEQLKNISTLLTIGDTLYALTEGAQLIHPLLRPGLALMRMEHEHAVPHHSLALSLRSENVQQELRLHYGDGRILEYLRGQTIPCDNLSGWVLITIDGAPLGWGKAVNGVVKNHYPKGLRRSYGFASID